MCSRATTGFASAIDGAHPAFGVAIARGKKCSATQLALAWLLAQGEDVVPIPGTKRREYLEQNVKAVEIKLTPEDLRRIEEVAPKGVAAGDRYPATGMATVNG